MSACLLMTTLLLSWRSDLAFALTKATPTRHPLTEHPPVRNLYVELVDKTSVIVHWEKPENITNNYIDHYKVEVRRTLHDMVVVFHNLVQPPVDHQKVADLQPDILYSVKVAIVYNDKGKKHVYGSGLHFNTSNPNVTSYCLCDPSGSSNSSFHNGTCEPNKLDCRCLENYAGSHCAICRGGHYRELHLPCVKCPCQLDVSDGDCEFDMHLKRPRCNCKPLKTGPLCEMCQRGYYQDPKNKVGCRKCSCPSLTKGEPGLCDPRTGLCTHCPNGTAGPRCEHCALGWSGAAPFCRPLAAVRPRHSGLTLLASVLAAAAVAVALGLGYWVMRLRARQKRLNAWSLELNRYELEHPGVVDSGSQSGLMMEEAAPGYGGASEAVSTAPGPLRKDDQLIFRAARLQLRSAEPPPPPAPPAGPLV